MTNKEDDHSEKDQDHTFMFRLALSGSSTYLIVIQSCESGNTLIIYSGIVQSPVLLPP